MSQPKRGDRRHLMSQVTHTVNLESWDRFFHVYYEPVHMAFNLLSFVGGDLAEDLAQSFFVKMYEYDLLAKRDTITGRFRSWLYRAIYNHAVDECRKIGRRRERTAALDAQEPADVRAPGPGEASFDADELYALSVLHMTIGRVRKHLLQEGKSEHWMIFEELALAPLIPGRVPKTRDELLAMFPGEGPIFLDNRMTTVKRVFRRVLPALIPADPTDSLTPEQRLQELFEILEDSQNSRLWLAFLLDPTPGPETTPVSSLDLVPGSIDRPGAAPIAAPEVLQDELRILLGFWLEMPLADYLDQLETVGAAVAAAIRPAPMPRPAGRPHAAAAALNLRALIDGTPPVISGIPRAELAVMLERLKTFAKRVHRPGKPGRGDGREAPHRAGTGPGAGRFEHSMPFEVAQVLYNLAGALALTRCAARIIGLSDGQFRKNLAWVLSQPWLDARLRPVLFDAMTRLGSGGAA